MIPELRQKYNQNFTEEAYHNFIDDLNSILKFPVDFRVAETPIFLPDDLTKKIITACNEIVEQLQQPAFVEYSKNAIPTGLEVPNEDAHTKFLQIDFAICKNENDELFPQLIELQGFPSLYAFQYYLSQRMITHFDIRDEFKTYFSGFDDGSYVDALRKIIVGDEKPENVILLEIEPDKQKTRIDFAATEALLGIPFICITDIIKKGNKLFYKKNDKEIEIRRIYNRVIYDEIKRKEVKYNFRFIDELDVTWVGHPNWFFKISKYTLPYLNSQYVPKCYFLKDLQNYPEDLENYVLKPLFSFAGLGVEIDLTKERLDEINDRENYILQKKIEYFPVIETPDEKSKMEIRMMYLWDDKPILANNLIRMSKGKMMGVDFNKNKTWVGSSCGFHRLG